MPPSLDPDAVRTLDSLAAAERQLGHAVDRLRAAGARARVLAQETNWKTDAATVFHTSAESWRRDVASLSVDAEGARIDVVNVRARIEAHVWRYGV